MIHLCSSQRVDDRQFDTETMVCRGHILAVWKLQSTAWNTHVIS